jgi:hypothetical protein
MTALLAPACETRATSGASDVVDIDALPTLAFEEVTRIGSIDDPDYGFSRIEIVRVADDGPGDVYVYEAQDVEIRAYSPDGRLLRRIGRRGEGPGEFVAVWSFGVRGDTVWVFDNRLHRLTLFTRAGELLSASQVERIDAPLHGAGQSMIIWPTFMDRDGLFVGDGGLVMGSMSSGPPRDTVHVPMIRFDAAGNVVDTVGSYPRPKPRDGAGVISVGRSRHSLPLPPSAAPRLIRTAHELIVIESFDTAGEPRLRISRVGYDGDTVRSRVLAYQPHSYPDAVLDSIAAARGHQTGPMLSMSRDGIDMRERHAEDSAAARAAIRRQMSFPDLQPPVQGHRVGAGESLWLQREDLGGGTRRWVVLDRDDVPVGELDLPNHLRVLWAGADSFWAIETDEWDVPWLVRYRISGGR